MEEGLYKIKFANGVTLNGLAVNGDNFVTKEDFDDNLLNEINLIEVTFDDGKNIWTENNLKKIHKTKYSNGDIYFTIAKKTNEELVQEELNAKIEYLAMMTEVEL